MIEIKFLRTIKDLIWKSKVGHYTVVVPFKNHKMKIFQAYNSRHAAFLKNELQKPEHQRYFHQVYFSLGRFVSVRWVEGVTCGKGKRDHEVIDWIVDLQSTLHSERSFDNDEQAGFNYLDYIFGRIKKYSPLGEDEKKIEHLHQVASSSPVCESRLSHADMTFRNIIRDAAGNFRIIDNELFTQSPLYLLDLFNTCHDLLPDEELMDYYLSRYSMKMKNILLRPGWETYLNAAWTLRIAGSFFQAGMVETGQEYLYNGVKGYEKVYATIGRLLD